MRIHNWIGKNSLKSTTGPKSDKIGCLYCIQNSDACSVLQISETPLAAEASSIIDVVVGRRFICCNSIRFEKGVYNYFCLLFNKPWIGVFKSFSSGLQCLSNGIISFAKTYAINKLYSLRLWCSFSSVWLGSNVQSQIWEQMLVPDLDVIHSNF